MITELLPQSQKIKILIADDHKLVRESWKMALCNLPGLDICGLACDGLEATQMAIMKKADIVLMDINMRPVSGFEAIENLQRLDPGIKIIAVSMNANIAHIKKVIRSGAWGYVNKNSSLQELAQAIEEVVAGNKYYCSETKQALTRTFLTGEDAGQGLLTERELSVIELVKMGLSSVAIGRELGISGRTVEVHRYNILKKLGLNNTASLINAVKDMGV